MNLREKIYQMVRMSEVKHTTLNPYGPGVVRIHLVPPKTIRKNAPSVAILNGKDILPLNPSWTILISEFIDQINHYDGHELSDDDLRDVRDKTLKAVHKIYRKTDIKRIRRDLSTIIKTMCQIAYGEDGKITGTMKNNGDVTMTPTTSEQIKEQGYYNSLKINPVTSDIDENIKPENIKKDVSILGVTGSLEASGGSDVTPIYETTEYTVKDISVDLNEVVDSISTYEQYVVVHTTLNKLKVYNKSNLI